VVLINLSTTIKRCIDAIAIQSNGNIAQAAQHTTIAQSIARLQLPGLIKLDRWSGISVWCPRTP
jgi:hypothetical protein